MVARKLLVPVTQDEQALHALYPSADEADNVQGGLVGPVQILDHQDGGTALPQFEEQCRGNFKGLVAVRDALRQRSTRYLGQVVQRSERTRREERLASGPEEARRISGTLAELAQQSRLADARFTLDQGHPAALVIADFGECVRQCLQVLGTF